MATAYTGQRRAGSRARRTNRQRIALAAAVLAGLALLGAALWLMSGGRWYVVATPSMGQDAPVGTLLWVEPVDPGSLHVGDFITFHPPGSAATYSHRILAITSQGIRTKGTISAPDPWTLRPSDVVGRVVLRWWAVGWLVRALPILVLGALATALVRRFFRGDWRVAVTSLGASVTLCVVLVVQHPLTNAVLLGSGADGRQGHATYVSTGLLPIRLSAAGASSLDLLPGARGTIVADATHSFRVAVGPALHWWMWALVVAFGLLPGLWTSRRRET